MNRFIHILTVIIGLLFAAQGLAAAGVRAGASAEAGAKAAAKGAEAKAAVKGAGAKAAMKGAGAKADAKDSAEAEGKLKLSGRVFSIEGGKKLPLEGAVVQIKSAGLYSLADSKGEYSFEKLDEGSYNLNIEFLGYVTKDTTIVLSRNARSRFDFTLEESSFHLEDVRIVAQSNKAGEATSSTISRQAIDHALTSSLSDVMQLLPGVSLSNPSLASAQSLSIRSASESAMNSLGTAVIVDGSPMSNNANREGITAAMNGTASTIGGTATFDAGSVPNSGVDVRTISTDNIESVEVIRGIPSVQYGDLTSGAVIINSKAGSEPLTVRMKTDPKIYQVSASKGFRISEKAGSLHLSSDYAYSNSKTTESYAYYQRLNLKAVYSKAFDKLSTTSTLDLRYGKDTRNPNPDDYRTKLATGGLNYGYRISTNGTWSINRGWLKSIRYDLSNSLTVKNSFKEQICSNAAALYTFNMVNGTTVSNVPGLVLYDTEGKAITNFTQEMVDSGVKAFFSPDSYFSHYDFYGKELNTYAKVVAKFFKSWGKTSESILAGMDFKSDGNLGKGFVFDENTPPPHSTNNDAGYRERPLYDIPFVNQTGIFAESAFHTRILHRMLKLTAGIRYDLVGRLDALSPRVNLSYELIPDVLDLRGGYGITAKAPTSAYLYPDKAYYDQLQYNNVVPETGEKLVIASTRIYDTVNEELEMARNRKLELGVDIVIAGRYTLKITAYDELMKNGYAYGACFAHEPYIFYTTAGISATGSPLFTPKTTGNKFFRYYSPRNSRYEHNRGLEYELNLGRFDAIRTSFHLNGAWMKTMSASNDYSYDYRLKSGSYVNANVSVYDPFKSKVNYEKFLSTLRITHNIPSVGFVVTLATQLNLFTRSWTDWNNDEYPQYYLDCMDGTMKEFTSEMASDPAYKYMYDIPSASRLVVSKTIPTVVFNLNLSKEVGSWLTASFYVNNIFNSRPLDPSEITPGAFTELNNPMYFGFELKIKI
ncbi:MAG: TonB-dependent receptor plug domain-containing protein [Candidatus Cryptobacteroides sp.]|nr:TonB-dependent receptor plug domain-containing protein [Candidatus Cryptobacteroides sp.]